MGLKSEERARLMGKAGRSLAPWQSLFDAHDPADAMYLVLSGRLRLFASGPAGERTLAIVGPGEPCGLEALLPAAVRSASAQALEQAEVLVIAPADFERLVARHPQVQSRVLRAAVASAHATERRLASSADSGARLAAVLHDAAVRSPTDAAQVEIKATPLELAAVTGMHVDALVALVQSLEKHGKMAVFEHGLRFFRADLHALEALLGQNGPPH